MRIFLVAVLAAVLLAGGFSLGLNSIQESTADAFAGQSTRLDQQEAINSYGREVN